VHNIQLMCWSFNTLGYCIDKLMFAIVYIGKQNNEYRISYFFEGKQEIMHVSPGMLEGLNPQQVFLLLRRIAQDKHKEKSRGRLVKEWN
jgi:hypothetical protein